MEKVVLPVKQDATIRKENGEKWKWLAKQKFQPKNFERRNTWEKSKNEIIIVTVQMFLHYEKEINESKKLSKL